MHTTRFTYTDPDTGEETRFVMHHHGDMSGEIEVYLDDSRRGDMLYPAPAQKLDLDPAVVRALMYLGECAALRKVINFCEG